MCGKKEARFNEIVNLTINQVKLIRDIQYLSEENYRLKKEIEKVKKELEELKELKKWGKYYGII